MKMCLLQSVPLVNVLMCELETGSQRGWGMWTRIGSQDCVSPQPVLCSSDFQMQYSKVMVRYVQD